MSKKIKSILGIIGLITTMLLSWIGLGIYFPEIRGWGHFPDRVYKVVKIAMGNDPLAMSMEPSNAPWQLIVVKILVVIILLTTFIKLFQKLFYDQYIQLRLLLFRHHTIICGLNEKGSLMLQDLKKCQAQKGVGVEMTEMNIFDKETLRKEGHLLLTGNITEKETLLEAGIKRAKSIICATESEQVGIEMLGTIHKIFEKNYSKQALRCYLNVGNIRLIEMLENSDQFVKDRQLGLNVRFFNYDKMIVRSFFEKFAIEHKHDIQDIRHNGKHFRLIVFGYNQLSKAMIIQAMRVLHFSGGGKTEIIVVDNQAHHKQSLFEQDYPFAGQIFPIRFMDYHGLYKNILREYVSSDVSVIPIVIFAFDSDEENIRLGLETLYSTTAHDVCIYCKNSDAKNIGGLLKDSAKESRLYFWGDIETFCQMEYVTGEKLDARAKIIHNNYLAKQRQTTVTESLVYKTKWEDLLEDARDSNRAQADHIPYKLAELGIEICNKDKLLTLSAEEVERLAIAEHERWSANRRLNGWQFGGERNDLLKLHPSLVPWEELPEVEKQKDRDTILQLHELV